jgi:uncharacterized membrane protein
LTDQPLGQDSREDNWGSANHVRNHRTRSAPAQAGTLVTPVSSSRSTEDSPKIKSGRLPSIDIVRGLVIVIMALDHVRDITSAPQGYALSFVGAPWPLFFTRWISHFCAPTFVFLAGVSAFLYGTRGRSKSELSRFLLSRGLWLVFVEIFLVTSAWNLNLYGENHLVWLQVIWVLGLSMMILGLLVWLPVPAIAIMAVVLIAGHNLLDDIQPASDQASTLWRILHMQGALPAITAVNTYVLYPLIPWPGVMALGFVIGPIFLAESRWRVRRLIAAGATLTLAFLVFRLLQLYGEPRPWMVRDTISATLVDFFDVTKYPPSLQYLMMTLGPVLILLGLLEHAKGRMAGVFLVFGRVPFFFYVIHLYVIHLCAVAIAVALGFSASSVMVIFYYYPKNFGIGLPAVYALWVMVVAALYPLCRKFAELKARRRDWWLSYL